MHSTQEFADKDIAEQIANALYPSAKSISMIEHSYDNIVALIDNSYAIRFPRNKNASTRSKYEKHILQKLEQISNVTVPMILNEHDNPPYLVTSYVPGQHLSTRTIKLLPDDLKTSIARKIARFTYSMHSTLDLNEELKFRHALELDNLAEEPWPVYMRTTIFDSTFQTMQQDAVAKEYYERWNNTCNVSPQVVVHDDLHTENMLFDDDHLLIGILDFGDTNVGIPEQDLRQLYRISEDVLQTAIREYENISGKRLDVEIAKTWAITQELAVYIEQLTNGKTGHRTFKRACRNLNTWLGKGDWGKGFDLSDSDGYQ